VDIHSGIIATAILMILFAILGVRNGVRGLQAARKMTFYRLRRQREAGSWRLVGVAILLFLVGVWLPFYGEPIAYQYFPPSPTPQPTPTITIVPTITVSPTITLSPTITDTPLVTDTPTITPTPYLPQAILVLFQSAVTPNPATVFSPLLFTTASGNYPAVNPATVFRNPVGHMYGVFSYDKMSIGAQWTALWYQGGQLVHFETKAWNCVGCSTGGPGFTDWNPPADQWKAGGYSVQIFVGEEWKVIGQFLVQGNPPTPIPSLTSTSTQTVTPIPTPSRTATPSNTPTPTASQMPTQTASPTAAPKPSPTP
jgi:hypothetical protein